MKINIYQPLDNYKKALLSKNVFIFKTVWRLIKNKNLCSNTNTLTENVDLYYLNGLSLIEKGLLVYQIHEYKNISFFINLFAKPVLVIVVWDVK